MSEAYIQLHCMPGGRQEGSFTISCGRSIKGIVYSSSCRMRVEHRSFHSRNVRMNYSFDSRGMWGGEEITGEFCIVTEAGELILPYRVLVEEHRKPEEESYAYFISADPIGPLPAEEKREQNTVVEIVTDEQEDMTGEEALHDRFWRIITF